MAAPPNLYLRRINPVNEFFDDTIATNDDIEINIEELKPVDHVTEPH